MKFLAVKKNLLFFLAGLFFSFSYCQDKELSAEELLYRNALTKAEFFLKRAFYDSAIYHCNYILKPTDRFRNKKYEAEAYNILAEVMMANGKMAEMRNYDSLLEPIVTQIKDTNLIISVKNRIGVYLMEKGQTGAAADNFLEVLKLKLEKEQSLKTAEVYSNLASVYLALSKNNQAMEWFFKSLRLYEKLDNDLGQGETYSNIASLYYLMGKTEDAISYQKKSIFYRQKQNDVQSLIIPYINIGQLYLLKDSFAIALQYLKLAVEYAERINNLKLKASAYSGMSTYSIKEKKFDEALKWQNKSIELFEETDNKPMLSRLYVSAGNLANATRDSIGALNFYNKALGLSIELQNKENIANAYQKMSNFFESHKDYVNAYRYYKNYTLYRDTIAMSSALASIEKVKIQYETEKKDNEIRTLGADQRIKKLQIEKQNALIAGNKLEARQKEKEIELLSQAKELQELKIRQQDQQLEKQLLLAKTNEQQLQLAEKEKLLQQKQLKNSKNTRNFILAGVGFLLLLGYFLFNRYQLKRKIAGQQALLAVRNDIAKDLHDEIGSTLTSIKILSEVSEKSLYMDQGRTSAFLQKITEQSTAAQQGISDIVWSVKPENDKLENMVVRIREYVAQTLESKNIHTIIHIDEQVLGQTLSMHQRRDLFLIFKEAINNIAKYAEANNVEITLQGRNNDLLMQIKDDGKGFDVAHQTSSNGLKNMKDRAASLNGRLDVYSDIDKGSSVNLIIPAT